LNQQLRKSMGFPNSLSFPALKTIYLIAAARPNFMKVAPL